MVFKKQFWLVFFLILIMTLKSTTFVQAQTIKTPKNDFSNSLTCTFFSDWFGNEKLLFENNYRFFKIKYQSSVSSYSRHLGLNYTRIFKEKYPVSIGYYQTYFTMIGLYENASDSSKIEKRNYKFITLSSGYIFHFQSKMRQSIQFNGGISYNEGHETRFDTLIIDGGFGIRGSSEKDFVRYGLILGANYKLYLFKGINLNLFLNYHNDFARVYYLNTGFGFGYSF
jgi:hypothetical protein